MPSDQIIKKEVFYSTESEGAILTSAMEGIAIPEQAFAEARKG